MMVKDGIPVNYQHLKNNSQQLTGTSRDSTEPKFITKLFLLEEVKKMRILFYFSRLDGADLTESK
jgi:hypothetical protein